MAEPKSKSAPATADHCVLPPNGDAVTFDDRWFEELLKRPGVVVYHGDPALAKQFTPLKTVGRMSLEELRRLMGREPDPDDENDPWYWGEDDEDESGSGSPIGS